MLKIKKGDIVVVTKGKDKGKKGKVLNLFASDERALVEGINMAKKAMRKTQANQQGGITAIEKPMSIANIMLFCKGCNKPVRTGFKIQDGSTKVRFCKSCKEPI